ncbi:hypothetical protein HanIR_Chr06g0294771 [Helianthus annuus]|nr:hypothetical protein HanIR_Chr06g0294771 [Helianthus annuus]
MIQQQATTNQWWRMAALTQRRDRERGNDGGSAVCGGTTGNKQSCDGGYGSDGCFIFSNMSPGNPSHLSLSLSLCYGTADRHHLVAAMATTSFSDAKGLRFGFRVTPGQVRVSVEIFSSNLFRHEFRLSLVQDVSV